MERSAAEHDSARIQIFTVEPRWQLIVIRDGRTHLSETLSRELPDDVTPRSILERVGDVATAGTRP